MDHGVAMLLPVVPGMYLLMAKPDYAALLAQIASETDPTTKQALIDQCYTFPEPLTDAEKDLFNYAADGYIDDNPGYDDQYVYISYAGKYYNDDGDISQ